MPPIALTTRAAVERNAAAERRTRCRPLPAGSPQSEGPATEATSSVLIPVGSPNSFSGRGVSPGGDYNIGALNPSGVQKPRKRYSSRLTSGAAGPRQQGLSYVVGIATEPVAP